MGIAELDEKDGDLVEREFTTGVAGLGVELGRECAELIDGRGVRHGKTSIEGQGRIVRERRRRGLCGAKAGCAQRGHFPVNRELHEGSGELMPARIGDER